MSWSWSSASSWTDWDWDWEWSSADQTLTGSDQTLTQAPSGHAAVAAYIMPQSRPTSCDDQAAVAGTGDVDLDDTRAQVVYNLEYFQSFCSWTGSYKQHNIALKWFRDSSEPQSRTCVVFDNTNPAEVPEIVHPKGMQYHFNQEIKNAWTWQEMIAQMDERSMQLVVEGPENRSRGLVSCRIQQIDKYDHKRHHAGAGKEVMLKEWDFILTRDDATEVWLHPNFSETKMACKLGVPYTDHEIPKNGKGGTNGPGTCKYFKTKQVHDHLRFDAAKGKPQSRSKAASSSGT